MGIRVIRVKNKESEEERARSLEKMTARDTVKFETKNGKHTHIGCKQHDHVYIHAQKMDTL